MATKIIKLEKIITVDRNSETPLLEALNAAFEELNDKVVREDRDWIRIWNNATDNTWNRFLKVHPNFTTSVKAYTQHPLRSYKPVISAEWHSIPLDYESYKVHITNFDFHHKENDQLRLVYESPELVLLEIIDGKLLLAKRLGDGETSYKPFLYTILPDVIMSSYRIED